MKKQGATEDLLDLLSESLATAVSRRAALQVLGKGFIAVLASAIGAPRFWARNLSLGSALEEGDFKCPACGTCEECDIQSGKCGLPCSTPCEAALLCKKAISNPSYVALQQFLKFQGVGVIGSPLSISLKGRNTAFRTILVNNIPR